MSKETARLVERLRNRLQRALRRLTWAELAFGGAVAAGSLATLWLVAAVLEATLWLGTGLRTGLVLLGGASILGVVAVFVARPLARLLGLADGPSEKEVARTVGEHYPDVEDRLIDLLQLVEGERSHAPAPYVDRAVQHLARQVTDVQFEDVADFRPARRAARLASLPFVAVLAFLLVAPSTFLGASERLLAPRSEFSRPAPFRLSVRPGDIRLVKGDSLRITVRSTGAAPESAALLLRQSDDDSPERIALRADTVGTFRHVVPNVRESLRYRVVASPVRSSWYSVDVVRRPFLRRLQVRVTPPAYTNRPTRELAPNVGDVTALPGSRVSVSATLGGPPIAEALIAFESGNARPLSVADDSASGTFVLQREGSYVLRLRSKQGTSNRDPIRYETSLQPDARPSISFLEPEGTANLSPSLIQKLRLQLSDDYGFRRVKLFYRLADNRGAEADSSFSSMDLSLPDSRKTDQVITHEWLLAQESNLSLERGDEVVYYAKVWDNDTVNGPKTGRTTTQRLRFPSLSEQFEQLDETKKEADEQAQELQRQSNSVRQQFRELRDEIRRTREANWEDRRQLERLQQKQKSVTQSAERLSRQVEKLSRKMQRNNLSSPETAKKFQELKQAIEEITSPKLQEALKQLQKSMKKQQFPQMQKSLENAKARTEQQKKRLERALNLLEQLKARQKLEELSRRSKNLRKQETEIAEKTEARMEETPTEADSSGRSPTQNPAADSTSAPSDSTSMARSDSTGAQPDSASASQSNSSAEARSDSTAAAQPDSASVARSDSTTSPADSAASKESAANRNLSAEQKRAAQQMKKLMKAMKEAQRQMKDVPSAPRKKLKKLNRKLRRQNLPQKMRKNSQQLRKNNLQKARQQQQQIQKRLQNMQSQLSGMKKQMKRRQRRMNIAGLRSALEDVLRLSQDQEDLRKTVEELNKGSSARRYASDQKALSDGLRRVADSLQSIASRLPEMSQAVQKQTGNSLRAMEKATSSLDARRASEATGHQKMSMMHLNKLAALLSNLLDQIQKKSSGGGGSMSMRQIMKKLQKASGQQQKLNQQIQKFLNQAQGKRLSKNMEKRRKQLAKQQQKIKKQLEEMNVGSEAQKKILGDLQKIAKQMQKSAEDLREGRRDRELLKRQRQIMTRLLNAQKSLRTQGKKRQRRGRTADSNSNRQPPGERPEPDEANTLRRDLIRALEMGYNPDYEELIKRYFELLQERNEPEQQ
ncbi:MAG: DUF4175 family protein [Salinibacter sp.]|uniref:DUF4175 family protein n=1 Tax=Salinibacter sp. TaxID=2065818 RepID=UPI0035D4A76E